MEFMLIHDCWSAVVKRVVIVTKGFLVDGRTELREHCRVLMFLSLKQLSVGLVGLLFCPGGFCQYRPWIEVRSQHFRVITNGNERAGQRVAHEFEQMRAVFANQFPGYRLDSGAPLLILAPA